MSFLTAEWRKLIFVNFSIDERVLEDHIPAGTELDLWEGKCYISLVGMMFHNTRLLGVKVPFHKNFEEVNLRFYVKRLENGIHKKGVVFLKEIVPKPALTFVAKSIYNENYETLPMDHSWLVDDEKSTIEYQWEKNDKWNAMKVSALANKSKIVGGSETDFIIERYWGYAHVNDKKSIEYEVRHPRWEMYDVLDHEIDVDFGSVYGEKFHFLSSAKQISVMLAEGSEVSIEGRRTISLSSRTLKST